MGPVELDVVVVVVPKLVVVLGMMPLQSTPTAGAFVATNRPGSSRRTLPAPKNAQFRSEPVLIRTPMAPCGAMNGTPTPRAITLMRLPSLRTITLIIDV